MKITVNLENSDVEGALKNILNNSSSYYVFTFIQDPKNKEKNILKEIKTEGDIIGSKRYKGKMISFNIPYGSA